MRIIKLISFKMSLTSPITEGNLLIYTVSLFFNQVYVATRDMAILLKRKYMTSQLFLRRCH